MRKITKFRRSVKAISPIISVLLMIAIAVSAALVAYAWVSGYMDFTTTKVGKSIQIQSVSTNALYVQNVGDSPISLESLYVEGDLVTDAVFDPVDLEPSETSEVTTTSMSWEDASRVTIKIVTTDGISAQYTETFSGNPASSNGGTTQHSITVTQTANGVISPGTGSYDEGSTPSFNINPEYGYYIATITANGASVTVNDPMGQTYQFPALVADGSLTASFSQIVVTRLSPNTNEFSGVQEGDLLVVIANTRTSTHPNGYTTGTLTATADQGFGNAVEVASFKTGSSTGDRRAIAIFVKTATGTESGEDVTVTWSDSGVYSYTTCYQVFRTNVGDATTWTVGEHGSEDGIASTVGSLNIPDVALSGGSTSNVLSIAAIVGRDGPSTVTFSSLSEGVYNFNSGGAYSSTAYNYGLPVDTTNADWSGNYRVSGLLVQIEVD